MTFMLAWLMVPKCSSDFKKNFAAIHDFSLRLIELGSITVRENTACAVGYVWIKPASWSVSGAAFHKHY